MMKSETGERVSVFGIDIDRVTLNSAAVRLADWVESGEKTCRYVVTPNLDHVLLYQENSALRQAYAAASLVVADGWPLVTASKMSNRPLPERVAGSDLVPALFSQLNQTDKRSDGKRSTVFLLGAAPGVAEKAAKNIQQQWPSIEVVGTYSPPLGFEHDLQESRSICERINACRPDVLVVGFGAPKQELWLEKYHTHINAAVAIAAGATIDFFAGRQTRAPLWMQHLRLEWTHRLLTNPTRLAGRYLRNALKLPPLLLRERNGRNSVLRSGVN